MAKAKEDWLQSRELEKNGARLKTLPRLGAIIGPFRQGELTVFTGPTGTGKTTVLSQMSLDYAAQGVSTLWGSFEIHNHRLVRIMLQQIADPPLGKLDLQTQTGASQYEEICRRFGRLPITFLDVHGSTMTDDVIDGMQRAVDASGVRHVILDNLQFMLSAQSYSSLDKFDMSDRVVARLRAFATSMDCHVTLVIHPRKEPDDVPLGLASISGTAKATQEADNVIVLQKLNDRRYIEVKKNRYSGDLGRVELLFDPQTRLVREAPAMHDSESKPVEDLHSGI